MPKTDENKTLNNKIRKLAPEAIEDHLDPDSLHSRDDAGYSYTQTLKHKNTKTLKH